MSCDNIQILELLKRGLTLEEVAMALNYDIDAVKAVAMLDGEMRVELSKAGVEVQTPAPKGVPSVDDLQELAKGVFRHILEDSDEKGSVRLTAAAYIRDEGLGLKKPKVPAITFNVFEINARLQRARERRAELEAKVIELPGELAVVA